ncbi:hypothetical protein CAEBREN_26157 [Caenorhabditis brenneri]|uniref:F-box domain-containing protein n=1 Tax=Caenorhabditis brenneri TaxID=135651 RepID=G0NQT5_CAEBE|nr:hypothetical protein CAEBREN_26157 [Caenorhabditis brenneri]
MSSSATTSPVSLVDMPELPLKHILSYVGFRSLQSLRLVSKPLCQFIDTKKLHVQIDYIKIKTYQRGVELKLKSCGLVSHLEMKMQGEGTNVSFGDKSRYYGNTDYLGFSVNLLKYVFNTYTVHTQKRLEYSGGEDSTFLEMFQTFLSEQRIILRVFELSFRGFEQQAVRFLPFFDSNTLKSLIFNWIFIDELNFDLMLLEQWKKARFLFSDQKIFRVPIQHFGHFETANFYMQNITAQDLLHLKEKYTQSPVFSIANIYCERSVSPDQVYGESEENEWIFRCSDPNYALIIDYFYGYYRYCRTHISDTTLSAFE